MKEFIINSNGVALNPNIYQSTQFYKIFTAQLPNSKWICGYQYDFPGEFYKCEISPATDDSKQFDSEKEAAFHELKYLRERVLLLEITPAQKNELDQLLNLITDHFCQLKLFEF